jgi:SAM-dependent methyltransferase
LKTDLFDEATGAGVVEALRSVAVEVAGIDVDAAVLGRAVARHPGLAATVADVRALSLPRASVDLVFSNSTLDHFESAADMVRALRELVRILSPGGLMIVTLDNPHHPVVALRNNLPSAPLRRWGVVPYFIGRTWSMGRLCRELAALGMEVEAKEFVMHVPRVAVLHLSRFIRPGGAAARGVISAMAACESLSAWPTARFTGHYSAVVARKPE